MAQPQLMDTVTVAPGETYDVAVLADNPGDWLIHCHVLSHAETKQGMFGMTTVLEVAP